MRPALARYQMISDSARVKKFWKKRIAEPVLLSGTKPKVVARAVENRVINNGYFKSSVRIDTVFKGKKKARLHYIVKYDDPYRIGSVTFPSTEDDLSQNIAALANNSLLNTGDIYSLTVVKNERNRIELGLKERGYINFNSEFLLMRADSVSEEQIINLTIVLKPTTPPESLRAYRIGKIFIHDDWALQNYSPDTTIYENSYYLISNRNALRFPALKYGIFFKPDELYSRTSYFQTVRYLGSLPIARFANARFEEGEEEGTLDAKIFLTQRKKKSYSAEFNTIFRSTNYFGPGAIFSYSDRNVNRGAELWKVNLRGRFEVQVQEGVLNPAYELGIEFNYQLPRLYPKFLRNIGKYRLPKTNISFGYNLFNRLDLYRLNSFFADFGYRWNKGQRIKHGFNPIELIFTSVPEDSKSDEFKQYLRDNPGVARSFEDQFIAGAGYDFTYNPPQKGKSDFFFNGGLDAAGNLLYGIYRAADAPKDSLGRYTLFDVPFSQYVRVRTDFRYGFNFSKNTSIVSRFVAGVGIPYANSTVLPYVKQFYVGGTNSLRSFIARSVGPGSEVPPEGFNDLTGDIRLELNLEFRFTISGNFKSALFVDAGNIWLFNEDASRPNGVFRRETFLSEVAMSTGWGLRWDFTFVVARLDFGYSLRVPYLPEGERWTYKDIRFFSPVWNIAIGYPF